MIDTVFIVGPTGIGKTAYAIDFARKHNGEIVSADSMQIYKYMNIGSAKPTEEERAQAKHYLVDEIDPREPFSVYEYKQLAMQYIKKIASEGKLPIVCGGTGLYVNALVYDMDFSAPEGSQEYRDRIFEEEQGDTERLYKRLLKLDPSVSEDIHPNNVKRVLRAIERLEKGEKSIAAFRDSEVPSTVIRPRMINLSMERERLYERINRRVDLMYEAGLEKEVRDLMAMGFTSDDVAMKGIGYKEIMEALDSGSDADSAKELIKQNSRHYAKRQITWFKRYTFAETVEM